MTYYVELLSCQSYKVTVVHRVAGLLVEVVAKDKTKALSQARKLALSYLG